MTNPGNNSRSQATRDALLYATERMIAEKGMLDVSTRDILRAAGQRNQSALQYHFGTKDDLISATISRRIELMDARRRQMLETVESRDDLKSLIAVVIQPLIDLALSDDGAVVLTFLAQAITRPEYSLRQVLSLAESSALDETLDAIADALDGLSPSELSLRFSMVVDLTILSLNRWLLAEPTPGGIVRAGALSDRYGEIQPVTMSELSGRLLTIGVDIMTGSGAKSAY